MRKDEKERIFSQILKLRLVDGEWDLFFYLFIIIVTLKIF